MAGGSDERTLEPYHLVVQFRLGRKSYFRSSRIVPCHFTRLLPVGASEGPVPACAQMAAAGVRLASAHDAGVVLSPVLLFGVVAAGFCSWQWRELCNQL